MRIGHFFVPHRVFGLALLFSLALIPDYASASLIALGSTPLQGYSVPVTTLEDVSTILPSQDTNSDGSYKATAVYNGTTPSANLLNAVFTSPSDNECVYINNVNSDTYFVPGNSYLEWVSFKLNAPAGINVVAGCPSATVTTSCGGTVALGPNPDGSSSSSPTTETVTDSVGGTVTYVCKAPTAYTATSYSSSTPVYGCGSYQEVRAVCPTITSSSTTTTTAPTTGDGAGGSETGSGDGGSSAGDGGL